jgi:tRNA pseudouridine38-40 synthase
VVEYDGTDFSGYQSQGQGERTVQSVLGTAVARVVNHPVTLHAAGRTDTGVHALGQVVSFVTTGSIPAERMAIALNSNLPRDLAVARADEAQPGFHARFSAKSRTYVYTVSRRRTRSAIWGRYSLHFRRALNVPLMRECAAGLTGTHDFASFAKTGGSPGPTTVRTLTRLSIRSGAGDRLYFVVTANGFLRSMVRNLVGALLDAGAGDVPSDLIRELLARPDRVENPCAPAAPHGLCLWRVDY